MVEALAERAWCRAEDAAAVRERASFTVEAVQEREQVTDHDVAAFVDVVAESVGEAGRWVHHGLTSSDVLDTALGLQLSQAGAAAGGRRARYRDALVRRAREHVDTLCVGRTHGVHAEPTTFGVKLAGFAFEAERNLRRLERAVAQARRGRAVRRRGHLRGQRPRGRGRVLERLGLAREDVSTQVVPRDRHAELLSAIALAGAGLERFATELRHLQRTEVREVEEPFRAGPEGLVGDAAQAQPDRVASASPASRGCCAATRRPGSRTWPSGTSATSRTPRSSGWSCPTPRSCSTTPSTSPSAWWTG